MNALILAAAMTSCAGIAGPNPPLWGDLRSGETLSDVESRLGGLTLDPKADRALFGEQRVLPNVPGFGMEGDLRLSFDGGRLRAASFTLHRQSGIEAAISNIRSSMTTKFCKTGASRGLYERWEGGVVAATLFVERFDGPASLPSVTLTVFVPKQ